MKYLSVCSGVEAATVAWHHMGWQAAGFSEIEKFPSEVLAHHYPTVTNFGDMTKYKEWNLNDPIGLLVGGTPCQSFSVAGLRKGLDDPRGNLALTYLGILDKFRPKWCVWENVPGVLSSGGGRDFGAFLGALGELGYGFAYRVLDAQNFGVAQRRRRVFVVGCLGDWRAAAEVLFESDCLRGDIKKGRGEKKAASGGFVPSIASCLQTTCNDYSRADNFNMIAFENSRRDGVRLYGDQTNTLQAFAGTGGGNGPCVAIQGNLIGRDKGGPQGVGVSEGETMYTLTKADVHAVAFGWQNSTSQSMSVDTITPTLDKSKIPAVAYSFDSLASNSMKSSNPISGCRQVELAKTIDTTYPCPSKNQGGIGIMQSMAVRRLTPVECERLQGFPDNYTNIKDKCPDGPRYKAMGNSMAVPVMRWIGERINKVNSLL
jgi:DNA (cytosine-5)-methyltransferase 1